MKHHTIGHNLERTAEALGTVIEMVCITFPSATVQLAVKTAKKYKQWKI